MLSEVKLNYSEPRYTLDEAKDIFTRMAEIKKERIIEFIQIKSLGLALIIIPILAIIFIENGTPIILIPLGLYILLNVNSSKDWVRKSNNKTINKIKERLEKIIC